MTRNRFKLYKRAVAYTLSTLYRWSKESAKKWTDENEDYLWTKFDSRLTYQQTARLVEDMRGIDD